MNASVKHEAPCVVDENTTCLTCGEIEEPEVCQKSERKCGHHCNHTWTHHTCCWCGWEVPSDDNEGPE
jgi:hypothetical protein